MMAEEKERETIHSYGKNEFETEHIGSHYYTSNERESERPEPRTGHHVGRYKAYKDKEECLEKANITMKDEIRNPNNYEYDFETDHEPVSLSENHHVIWKRRQLTKNGKKKPWSGCDDSGTPSFDENGTPSWGPWINGCVEPVTGYKKSKGECNEHQISIEGGSYYRNECEGYVNSPEKVIDAIKKDRGNESANQSGKKSRVIVEYKINQHLIKDNGFLCHVFKKKMRDFPEHFTSASIAFSQEFTKPYMWVSMEPLVLKTIIIPNKGHREDGTFKIIGLDGKQKNIKIRVPKIRSGEKMFKKPTYRGWYKVRDLKNNRGYDKKAFIQEMDKNGFSGSISEYSNSLSKQIDYEEKGDYNPKFTCNIRVGNRRELSVLPYGQKNMIDITVLGDVTARVKQGNAHQDLKMAPKEVVEKCTNHVKDALQKSAIRIKNYPSKMTVKEFNKIQGN